MEELRINSPYCQALNDLFEHFDINSVLKTLRDKMYQSYTQSYMTHVAFIDDEDDMSVEQALKESEEQSLNENSKQKVTVYPVKYTIERITNGSIPDMKLSQFKTVDNNGIKSIEIDDIPEFWIQPVFSYVPDVYMNIRIVDDLMKEYGYIRVRQQKKTDENGRQWWFVIYNPDPRGMEDIRHRLSMFYLLHYTPEFNRDSILENGLLPSHGGRTYTYPDKRVFFYAAKKTFDIHIDPFVLPEKMTKMMKSVARSTKKKHPDWSGYFDVFELNTGKLPENVKVYWDPNAQSCMYLNIPIPADYLILREEESRMF